MARSPRLLDWISLLALTSLWGTSFFFNELALRSFPPSIIVAGRLSIAALMLAVVLRYSGLSAVGYRRHWLPIVIMALLGTIIPFSLTAWAQQHIDSAVTGIVMAIMPLFVVCLAHVFIPGERLRLHRVVGFVCGFLGVVCVIGPDAVGITSHNLKLVSVGAVLTAALSYAVSSVYTRRVTPGNPIVTSVGVVTIGGILAIPSAALDVSTLALTPSVTAVVAVLVLGLLCTGLASVLYFRIVQGPGPIFLSSVNYLIPAWAVFAGAVLLGETLSGMTYFGLALILTGIAISEFGQRVYRLLLHGRELRNPAHTDAMATKEA